MRATSLHFGSRKSNHCLDVLLVEAYIIHAQEFKRVREKEREKRHKMRSATDNRIPARETIKGMLYYGARISIIRCTK